MKPRYILGIDPSGSFKEGKGTTGWCVYDTKNTQVIELESIRATTYPTAHAYWNAHLDLIANKKQEYGSMIVSIEDYLLYKNKSSNQINSIMETSQLLGIIKHFCYLQGITYYIRPAVLVKKRWADKVLVHKKLLYKQGIHLYAHCRSRPTCNHERDAIRHAVHCGYFDLKEE